MSLIKITPDKERVKSILEMVLLIEERIEVQDKIKFVSLIISDYYEIIKELMTAFILLKGYKTLSHIELINYLKDKCSEITSGEIELIDKLRVFTNRINYEGFKIPLNYLESNKSDYKKIINKLKYLIKEGL